MEDYKLKFNKEGEMIKVPKNFIETKEVFITQNCDRIITGCFETLKAVSEELIKGFEDKISALFRRSKFRKLANKKI